MTKEELEDSAQGGDSEPELTGKGKSYIIRPTAKEEENPWQQEKHCRQEEHSAEDPML